MISNRSLTMMILFGFSLAGAYSIYHPFLLPLIVAMLLTMATYNLTKKLIRFTGSRKISAIISTLFLVILIFVPIIYLATIGVGYISQINVELLDNNLRFVRTLFEEVSFLKEWSGSTLSDKKIAGYIQTFTSYVTTIGGIGLVFIKDMVLVLIFYFIFNLYGERFFELVRVLFPVSKIRSTKMIHEISSTMEVVLYSIIITAIFEGFLFGFMVGNFGYNGFLLGVLFGFASLIPIVGGAVVWIPVALYAWSGSNSDVAILIALYSIVVISIIADTFVKPMIIRVIKVDLLKSTIDINEIVIFFSIFAGMSTYGFWGMVLGPAMTSFFIAITKLYIDYNVIEQRKRSINDKIAFD